MIAACLFLRVGDEVSVGGWSSFHEEKKKKKLVSVVEGSYLCVHTEASKYHMLLLTPLLGQTPAPDKPFNTLLSSPSYLWIQGGTSWYSITLVHCVGRM